MSVPLSRVATKNAAPVRPEREFVVYWMTAARRTHFNFALDHALDAARELGKPLLVLEGLRCDHPRATARLHRFVMDGMEDNAARFSRARIGYLAYVEPRPGAGRGLLAALGSRACRVIADAFPAYFLPRMIDAAAAALDVRLDAVDGNGLLPLGDADRAFPTAYAFRRHLQRRLPSHLEELPEPDPLEAHGVPPGRFPDAIRRRWPSASDVPELPAGRAILPVPGVRGGPVAARARLSEFVSAKLSRYARERNDPDRDATSGLSAYLHFGHLSAHELFLAVAGAEGWSTADLASTATGRREGWWGMSPSAEAFLDQAVTWRELGYNFCARVPGYDRFDSLPEWARRTLLAHAGDPRPYVYDRTALEQARTHDELWNAAQRQLVREGRIHNYLRMLWGKKILEWTRGPEEALEVMIDLNDRYALDGRDPNSYAGIFWVLGRYDRPWGPVRPIFGTIRFMSSASTSRKLPVEAYRKRFASQSSLL